MMMRNALVAAARHSSSVGLRAAARPALASQQQKRSATTHAISNPTLANIEKRWEEMPPEEQADLWMALRDRMKTNWSELTLQEKKAAYWIAFGDHGPRAQTPPGEGKKVFGYTMLGVFVSFCIFATVRTFARPPPRTMTREYQEMTDDYLANQNTEPISGGIGTGGKYTYVQSKPAGKM